MAATAGWRACAASADQGRVGSTCLMTLPLMSDVDFGVDPIEDFYERTATRRRRASAWRRCGSMAGSAWLILKYSDLAEAYADEENLPAGPAMSRHTVPIEGRTILAIDRRGASPSIAHWCRAPSSPARSAG